MTYLSQQNRYPVIYIDSKNVLLDNKIVFMVVCTVRFFTWIQWMTMRERNLSRWNRGLLKYVGVVTGTFNYLYCKYMLLLDSGNYALKTSWNMYAICS